MTGFPTMRTAFRTTVSGGGKYEMVFRFPSMDDLHAADDEWRAALATPASDVAAVDVDDAQALAREFKRMQGLIYCPGVLRCAKCDFRLIKTTLTPAGAFANEEPDSCPNCDAPMWRVTWQDEAKDAYKTAESQMNRALEAERALVAHPPHPAPVDPVETLAQRQAREVMRPQSGSALAQPPFGQVYGMATKPVDPVAGGEALREALKDMARGVFIDAATQTHHSWVDGTNGREPDFDEAAGDYAEGFADAYADNILAALKGPAA